VPARRNEDEALLARRLDQVADRLRHLPAARVAPVSAQVRGHVQRLARLSLAAEGRPDVPLPTVADTALGDQVAVLGLDLVAALRRRPDDDLLAAAHALVAELRRCLPTGLHV
jgi:hypothetical protein